MLTINTINVGASNSEGIRGSIWMGENDATNDSMPRQPDEVSVASVEIIMTIKVMPYPALNKVARTADQNPSWHTDRVAVEVASFNINSWLARVRVASTVDIFLLTFI